MLGPLSWTLLVHTKRPILLYLLLSSTTLQTLSLPTIQLTLLKLSKNFSNVIEPITFLISHMSYKPKTVVLLIEELRQDIKDADANYQSVLPHMRNYLLCVITPPLKILIGHRNDHQSHTSTALNINPDLKAKDTLKTHLFQMSMNHVNGTVSPPTPGGSGNTTPTSDVRIRDKMNTKPEIFPPSAVSFTNNMDKQDNPPSISTIPNLQVGKYATHSDYNGYRFPEIITKVTTRSRLVLDFVS